jgi:predicted small lipoprotein YifL
VEGEIEVMRFAFVMIAAATSLSACGLRGDLERPVPLWGNPPNEGPLDPRTIKEAEEKAKAEAERKAAEEAAAEQAPPAAPAPQ